MSEDFERVTEVVAKNKIGDMGRSVIEIFAQNEATPAESLICLYELRAIIAKQSGIISRPEIVKRK